MGGEAGEAEDEVKIAHELGHGKSKCWPLHDLVP